jgi:hypothetical protein
MGPPDTGCPLPSDKVLYRVDIKNGAERRREFFDNSHEPLLTATQRYALQAMSQQSRELVELAQKTAIESMGPLATGLGGALLGRPHLS